MEVLTHLWGDSLMWPQPASLCMASLRSVLGKQSLNTYNRSQEAHGFAYMRDTPSPWVQQNVGLYPVAELHTLWEGDTVGGALVLVCTWSSLARRQEEGAGGSGLTQTLWREHQTSLYQHRDLVCNCHRIIVHSYGLCCRDLAGRKETPWPGRFPLFFFFLIGVCRLPCKHIPSYL